MGKKRGRAEGRGKGAEVQEYAHEESVSVENIGSRAEDPLQRAAQENEAEARASHEDGEEGVADESMVHGACDEKVVETRDDVCTEGAQVQILKELAEGGVTEASLASSESPQQDYQVAPAEAASTQGHNPHKEARACAEERNLDAGMQAGATPDDKPCKDTDGVKIVEASKDESKDMQEHEGAAGDAVGDKQLDGKGFAAESVANDPVLERAERAMCILDDFIQKSSAHKASPVAGANGARASVMASPGVGGAMRVSPQVKIRSGVESIKREGVLCKRGDRWLKKWVDRRVLLQFGIVSYFKLPGTHSFPRAQMVLNPDSWAREVDHFDRDFTFQVHLQCCFERCGPS